MRIMFVDDEVSILSAFKRAFFRSGWDIVYAKSAEEALELLENFKADFIVTDIRMPGMNGAELLERVSERYSSAIRIVLSGHADTKLSVQASYVAHQWYDKPCDLELLKNEIERINEVRATLPYEKIQSLLGGIKSFPTIPRLFIKLKAMLQDNSVTIEDISAEISQNPSLTAKMLQVANSSFFVTGSNVTKVEDAIIRLGTEVICNIVAIAEIHSSVGDIDDVFASEILERALGTAKLASKMGSKSNKEEAMLAGLLHNIGELVLANINPSQMPDYLNKRQVGADNTALERSLFQVDNIQITSYLLHLWHLPYSIIRAISLQNDIEKLVAEDLGTEVILYLARLLQSNRPIDERIASRNDISTKLETWQEMVKN